jgi:hypothetical protein
MYSRVTLIQNSFSSQIDPLYTVMTDYGVFTTILKPDEKCESD